MGKTSNFFLNNFYNQFALASVQNTTKISIIVYTALAVIVIDTILNQNSEIRFHLESSGFSVALFIVMWMILIVGNFYVLEFVRQKSSQIRKKVAHLRISYKIVFLIQYLVISIFVFVLVQIISIQQYPTIALTIVTTVTYGLTIGLMGIFTKIFFSWYKSNRNSIVILLYGLSFAAVVIASAIFLTGSLYRFVEKPLYISHEAWTPLPKSEPGSFLYNLGKAYHYSDILSFLLKWVATALLLYHYSKKMGKTKYWILISLPLVYFVGTYLDDYHLYEPHTEIEELYWHLYTSLNSTAGGILFYIGFVIAARHFHGNMVVKDYLIMCGFGFLLFFSAGQGTLANTLYPPFGLATMSLYGLSTYMILLGLYSCAISVSEDIELRKSIKKSTLRESKFLESMGSEQMERDLTRRMVLQAREEQKERIQRSAGIKSSLTDVDIINII
ncbi:MAG TPA: hypothetical protein VFX75_03970 [Nitrososphaeraceae archaeon]|nr:hypothetical protein [Nitrososphaeraceae archaeon]